MQCLLFNKPDKICWENIAANWLKLNVLINAGFYLAYKRRRGYRIFLRGWGVTARGAAKGVGVGVGGDRPCRRKITI